MQGLGRALAGVAASVLIVAGSWRAHGQTRPGGDDVRVWTSDVVSNELAKEAVRELKPILLVGARNGAFSGKLVVESAGGVKGLKASAGPLSGPGGVIAAGQVQIRYGQAWDKAGRWAPKGPDILLESPAEAVSGPGRVPVWVTVQVPKGIKGGMYSGAVRVEWEGAPPVEVKLHVEVADWTLPDPQEYRTWTDFVQSPDTLALEYNVPLWSDKHWALIDRSFRMLSPSGCRVLYVPLITGTNFGNEQSMVRWISKGGNGYAYDYTVLDKYLESAGKNLGQPKLVVFVVWDICMSLQSLKRGLNGGENETRAAREELLGKGPRVTVLDPATGEARPTILPRYEDPASKALWQPLFAEVKKRMAQRGLEKTMMLGIMPDLWPNKEEVVFWNEVSGGLAWAIHGHAGRAEDVRIGNKGLYKIADIGYSAFVYNLVYNVDPDQGRMYGWRNPALLSAYLRMTLNNESACYMRQYQAFNITGGQRGGGRMGADFWPALRNKKGERAGPVYARYPENNWRNLDISDWFLAPGPEGAVATARLESLREGTQVCEARIYLEAALLDERTKGLLGGDLGRRCQDALDEHHRAVWKTAWNTDEDLKGVGVADGHRNPQECLWYALVKSGKKLPEYWSGPGGARRYEEARKGEAWFGVGWQAREKKLFDLAGEVAGKVGAR